jgi:hypothetical protein
MISRPSELEALSPDLPGARVLSWVWLRWSCLPYHGYGAHIAHAAQFAGTSASAGGRPIRLTGVVFGLIVIVSIISQLR